MTRDTQQTGDYRTGFIEGFRARRERGADIGDNPYSIDQNRAQGWEDGWQTAWDEDVRTSELVADQFGERRVETNL